MLLDECKLPETALQLLLSLDAVCHIRSQERPPLRASKSELRRICDQSGFHINGKAFKSKDPLPENITSVILFPKSSKRKITLL
jgi:hypothetical protein